MQLIWRTDVHMADRSPRGRADDWTETVSDKLEQVGVLARSIGAAAVIDGGDYFDEPNPSHNSHELVRRTARIHAGYPCPTYANVGNHDVRFGSIENLDKSPLAVLFESGVFRRCYDEHEVVLSDPGGTTVRIVGRSYRGARFDLASLAVSPGSEDHLVVLLHQLASPDPTMTFFPGEDVLSYDMIRAMYPTASVVCVGHWHKNQGVREVGPGRYVVNIGSLTRGTLAEDDVSRIPEVAVLRLERGEPAQIFTIPLRVRPPEQVFRDRAEVHARPVLDASCLAEVATAIGTDQSSIPLEEHVRQLGGISEPARQRVLDALARARVRTP